MNYEIQFKDDPSGLTPSHKFQAADDLHAIKYFEDHVNRGYDGSGMTVQDENKGSWQLYDENYNNIKQLP